MPDATNKDKNYWKETILKINDRKLLQYICDVCRARMDIGRADNSMKKGESDENMATDMPMPMKMHEEPVKLEPIMGTRIAKEDEDEY